MNSNLRRSSLQNDHNRRSVSADRRSRSSLVNSATKIRPSSEERKSGNLHGWNSNRRSSILNEPKGLIKDPRPLNDKAYQKRKILELVKFLQEDGFQYPITPAKLMQPSKKDFENIFQHFVKFWDERYVVKRIEEEAPKILKDLCYPFIPNKSAFLYVARTNWPPLLGVLLFLMDVTVYLNNVDPQLILRTAEGEQNKVLLEFIYNMYWSKNEDEEVAKDMLTKIAKEILIPCDMDELIKRNHDLKSNVEDLQSEVDKISSLEVLCSQQSDSLEKYEDYFRKMKDRHQKKMEACQKLSDELDSKKAELQKLNAIKDEKQAAYDAQGFDGRKRVTYFEKQRKELEEKLQEKKAAYKDLQQKCWEVDMQHTEAIEKSALACESFNDRYSSVSQMANKITDNLQAIPDPQVKSLCSNLKIDFPDYKMKPTPDIFSQGTNPRKILEEINRKIDSTNAILESLIAKQDQIMSENEVKMSGLSMAMKVASVEETQKERGLNSDIKQRTEMCRELETKYDETFKVLQKLQAQKAEAEKKFKDLSEEFLLVENMKKDKQNMLDEYLQKQQGLFSRYKKVIEETKAYAEECGEEIYKTLRENIK